MEKLPYQGVSAREVKPYENLFIYLLDGVVDPEDEKIFGDHFLGNWVEGEQSFLFFSRPAGKIINDLLDYRQNLKLVDEYCFSYEEWQGGLPEAIQIEDFLIVSPWVRSIQEFKGIKLLLDPGVVFGNGLHPTTRDCLRALSLAHGQQSFGHVLDFGTGTGVLSIAAAQLGAKSVIAADLNPLCVRTTLHNVELNSLGHIIQVKPVSTGVDPRGVKVPAVPGGIVGVPGFRPVNFDNCVLRPFYSSWVVPEKGKSSLFDTFSILQLV